MDEQTNKISVGGSVGGNVVAGNRNVVGTQPAPTAAEEPAPRARAGYTPRLGFVVDIVGFGRRSAAGKDDVQERLGRLVDQVLADLEIEPADTYSTVAGDSKVVFLPVGADSSRAVPGMINAMRTRLKRDNARYRDRIRLRMAVGTGLVGDGPLGFTGELIVDIHRLVDSPSLRKAIKDRSEADLAILVSQSLHDEVIRPGFLKRDDFTPVKVEMKEFTAPAWLHAG